MRLCFWKTNNFDFVLVAVYIYSVEFVRVQLHFPLPGQPAGVVLVAAIRVLASFNSS